jgi:hypothetical protein
LEKVGDWHGPNEFSCHLGAQLEHFVIPLIMHRSVWVGTRYLVANWSALNSRWTDDGGGCRGGFSMKDTLADCKETQSACAQGIPELPVEVLGIAFAVGFLLW